MSEATITLPWPPSVNRYWLRHQGRVLISREGLTFRDRVGKEVVVQQVPRFGTARLAMVVDVHPPDRRARDLDNLTKSVLDALEAAGVYQDDAQIDDLRICRKSPEKPGRVQVYIKPMEEDA